MGVDPEFIIQLVLLAVVAGGVWAESWRAARKGATSEWRRAVEASGLTDVRWSSSSVGKESFLTARSGELSVRLEPHYKGTRLRTRIVIEGGDDRTAGITLRGDRAPLQGDVEVGDE